ncbi:MAG: hypothetical protein JWL84_3278 [Rhodospirillales bacterium]|jgi:hypothetical protein|nr:hypothetical protein [Rhodospirillales bacterium]
MRMTLIAGAALIVAASISQAPARAESVIDRVLGGSDQRDNRDRQDVQRQQDQIDRAREEGRREGREDSRYDARNRDDARHRDDGRLDRGLSGSSRDPRERRHDDD